MKNNTWKVSDIKNAKFLGDLTVFNEKTGDDEIFSVLETSDRLVFGGTCNVGFLESGFILKEDFESVDETLQELHSDLEVYYRDGAKYTDRVVCNERM